MEEYVYIDGKQYKRGYTTGSCATGAAKAAAYMLLTRKPIDTIQIDTPKGIPLSLKVEAIDIGEDYVSCAIQKDGGDDIDITHKAYIHARVSFNTTGEINILGGIGVGTITKKGLGLGIGEAAINKVPREMIRREVSSILGKQGTNVTIYVPEGERLAKKTFNPRLGIVGGISIIGTTGIVEPMSEEGWKKSLSLELEMKKNQGLDKIVLVNGNHGEKFAKEVLGIEAQYLVRTSNFIGYMLLEAKRIGYKQILMIGHLGKYIKVAGGIFHTHSKVADARAEILVANLALMGATQSVLESVYNCLTTEEALDIIETAGYKAVYNRIANKCKERSNMHLGDKSMDIEVIVFSLEKGKLGQSMRAESLVEAFK